ncbi:MAG: hypothetical protein AB1Y26_08985 [Cycloclasticus sp.]
MKNKLLAAAIIAALPLTSQAVDFSYKGFGSLVGGLTTDKADYQPSVKHGDGYYDQSFDIDAESRLAVQFTAQFNSDLSVVGQVITRGARDWELELPWLYVNYQATDAVQIRVGRMKAPYYPYSDFQDVGFALPWISAPTNAYIVPADHITGINVLTTFSTGAIDHTLEMYASVMEDTLELRSPTPDIAFDDSEVYGVSLTSNYDWLTTRVTYNEGHLDLDSDSLEGLNAAAVGIFGAGSSMDKKTKGDQLGIFMGFHARADFEKVFFIAEYNILSFDDLLFPHQERAYITTGYRVTEKFTPYLTLSKNDDNNTTVTATGDPALDAGFNALSAGSNAEGWAIGGRYDLTSDIALKAEYSSTDYDNNVNDENTFRFAVDFIF